MKSAHSALLALLSQPSFSQGEPEDCAALCANWCSEHQLNAAQIQHNLTQFAAQLLHHVRKDEMNPSQGAELLARLIALSDLEIPPSVFALQEVLQTLADQHITQTNQEQIKKEMGRILPTLPKGQIHESDRCRYTGRYQETRRSA